MNKPVIEFKNFTYQYMAQAEPTLYNIDFTVNKGEKVLILGPSGSGKSTLINCINGLIPFTYPGEMNGSVKIMGHETKNESLFKISKMVGTVLQDPDSQFIGLTVGEDIAFQLENDCVSQDKMIEKVKKISKIVDINNFLDSSPQELSGGQKQRVTLGGVMVDDAGILIFDEPLANLDPAAGKKAIELIDDIHKRTDTTIIIVEHRLEDVLHCDVDRIIVVNEGRIIADTTPGELLSSNTLSDCGIREPLYISALKYAGCRITPTMKPEHIETINVDKCREKLKSWYESSEKEKPVSKSETILELKDIQFGYVPGKEILHHISFKINKGEMVSIVGKNGAGKSTMSKLICGFYKPTSGSILFKGRDISSDTIKERAEKIGYVMQNPNQMISKSMIFDEVAMGLRVRGINENEVQKRVYDTLKICGLYEFRKWPVSALSFGQKKRVTIASILVLNPEIIILDEPTAGQDFRHYTEIMEFLLKLNKKGVTIIMITHDMHLMLEYTRKAIVIADGCKIAEDTAANVLTDADIIRKASLKETSLYGLAKKIGIDDPRDFVKRFIEYERGKMQNDK